MSLRMGDGLPANLPAGLDAYAGYVNKSGIGVTYPQIVADHPASHHLSITTDGSPAQCADVESGAMGSWAGYMCGYAAVSDIGTLILRFGRRKVLWSAHHTDTPHICTSQVCWPSSPVAWIADGTQWTDHGGAWDESLLNDNFFTLLAPPPTLTLKENMMVLANDGTAQYILTTDSTGKLRKTTLPRGTNVQAIAGGGTPNWGDQAAFIATLTAAG